MRKTLILLAATILLASCHNKQTATEEPEPRTQITLTTTEGDIVLELYNETPLHRDNFIRQAESGYFDSLLFHRVIENFMIQSGDPTSKHAAPGAFIGDESKEELIPAEILYPTLYHKRGALAAAREGDDVNPEHMSSPTQFYIVWGRTFEADSLLDKMDRRIQEGTNGQYRLDPTLREYYRNNPGTPHLDGSYTVFGEVVEGLDIVGRIQATETDTNDRPIQDIRILHTTIDRR